MLGDKLIYFEEWDCPDTIQAAFRYPGFNNQGFDVVYEGMMNSSIDDGGLEFRGTEATLKINRSGFTVHRERVEEEKNPALTARSVLDADDFAHGKFLRVRQVRVRSRMRRWRLEVAAARAGHIGNLAGLSARRTVGGGERVSRALFFQQ